MSKLDITIAEAQPDDAGELLTLQRAAFLHDAQLYGDPFLPSLVQTVDDLRAEILARDRIVIVARIGARVVGSVRSHQIDRTAHITRLMTAPDLEGHGIGGRLLADIEQRLMAQVDRFQLGTGAESTDNIAMYARRGYVECERRTDPAGIVIVMMTKPAGT